MTVRRSMNTRTMTWDTVSGGAELHAFQGRSAKLPAVGGEYWLTEYHMDGLRMDAISRAIYWQGMPERGVNSNAVEFLKYMNQGLKALHPDVILAAEDSTSFPGVTKPVEEGGLGFDYKWDMAG